MPRVALQIPGNWIVYFNEFYDEEPLLPDGSINKEFNDSQDLMWMEYLNLDLLAKHVIEICKLNNGLTEEEQKITRAHWEDPDLKSPRNRDNISLDLGWYGDNAKTGEFGLRIYRGRWEETLFDFRSRSKDEIIEKINYCLQNIHKFRK